MEHRAVLVAAALAWSGASSAQDAAGFAEVIVVGFGGVEGVPIQVAERVRPQFSKDFGEHVRLVGTIDAVLSQGRSVQSEFERTLRDSDLGPLLELAGCTWPRPENAALNLDGPEDYLRVDRLYVDLYAKWGDFRIGRQAVQWGSAQFFNPTDPFPQVFLTEPWANRRGVNVARGTIPLGGSSNRFQLMVGSDDLFRYLRAASRITVNALQTDFSLVGAYRGEVDEGLVGVDVRGTAGIGYWLEGAVRMRPLDPRSPGRGTEAWAELAVGADYSFPVLESLLITGQYYYNGREQDGAAPGLSDRLVGPTCETGTPLPEAGTADPFASFVRGTHYGLLGVNLAITPDVSVSLNGLHGFDDHTGILLPTVSVRPTGWLTTTLNVQLPYDATGGGGEFKPASEDLVLRVPDTEVSVDLSGLVPSFTAILWTRASF